MIDQPQVQDTQPELPRRRSPLARRLAIAGAVIVALIAGVGIGAAANSHSSQLAASQKTVHRLDGQVGTLNQQVGTLKQQLITASQKVATAQNAAATAQTVANTRAAAKYAARMSALQSQQSQVASTQKRLNRQLGAVQASQIGGQSAVYVVGTDMQAGLYHTQGSTDGSNCYFATLNSTNTSDIADNNDFTGPETVQVNSYAFETDGSCTWVKVG
jgi:hypothetical protein